MTSMKMSDDPVLQRISEALDLYNGGRRAEAREQFSAIWNEIEDGDAFHQCVLAHYMADAQDEPADELEWDRRALAAADRIVKDRPDAAGLSVLSLYPSLHLNLADAMRRTGDLAGAKKHVELARQASGALGNDDYGQMIRGGIERLAKSLT